MQCSIGLSFFGSKFAKHSSVVFNLLFAFNLLELFVFKQLLRFFKIDLHAMNFSILACKRSVNVQTY